MRASDVSLRVGLRRGGVAYPIVIMPIRSFSDPQIFDASRFQYGEVIVFFTKSLSITRKAGATARTLLAYKSDYAVRGLRRNSHATIAKSEVKRFDGKLIAEDGDGRWMAEEV